MINVTVFRNNNHISAFELSGHAESGPYGYDLVCAGVSAVAFGAVNSIHALFELDLKVEQADEGGYLFVSIPNIDSTVDEKVQILLEGMLISLKTIELEYSQFIKIKTE